MEVEGCAGCGYTFVLYNGLWLVGEEKMGGKETHRKPQRMHRFRFRIHQLSIN